jgi:gamma-glutamyltranspeptidase/glutathione hydrolase
MNSVRVVASDGLVRDAAEDAALGGASALEAALTGYFAACGAYAGVLLSPFSLLLFGFGAARALDGRVRQPGLGGKRPRGFLPGDVVPPAARIGVPAGPTAALVGLGYDKARRLSAILKPGVALAKSDGAPARAQLLSQIHDFGAAALSSTAFYRPLIHVAGPSEGGMLTSGDFTTIPEVDLAAERALDGSHLCLPWGGGSSRETPDPRSALAPWDAEASALVQGSRAAVSPEGEGSAALELEHVAAIDAQGIAAVVAYHRCNQGLVVPALELLSPLCAEPVSRGVTRVKPGTPLPHSVVLSLGLDERGRVVSAECGTPGTREHLAVSAP